MSPDGISYLDLASETTRGGLSELVSGYWSPGYPALISIAFALFRPSADHEVPLVHVVNVFLFLFALWAFTVLLRYWPSVLWRSHRAKVGSENKLRYVIPFAFSTFLWLTLAFNGPESVHPDLGVTAVVFLAGAMACRLCLPASNWKHYVVLGAVLAAGYYFKAAMFPLGWAFLGVLSFLTPPFLEKSRRWLLLSALVFVVLSAPLLVTLSIRAGRPSFGEAGWLNYVWYVNGLQRYTGWTGGSPDVYGTPEHPPRTLVEKPLVLEFASPIKGTYPLWYDAPYWYAGAKVHFDLRRLLTAVKENVLLYKDLVLSPMAAFIAGAIVLYVCLLNGNIYPALPRQLWWQLAWPVTAFSMFALVHVEGRFLGGLLVLFWLAVYGALALRSDGQITVAVCATVLGTVMIPLAFHVARLGTYIPGELLHPRPSECQIAASGLRNLGLQDGSRVAVVGTVDNAYYARCARLRVIAQIPNQQEFWRMSAPELRAVEERLTSVGVEALVAANRPNSPAVAAWKDVQASDSLQLNVRVLSPQVLPRD